MLHESSYHPSDTHSRAQETIARVMDAEPMLNFRHEFLREFPNAGLYLVGGAIRDLILGRANKDFDFVATGVSPENINTWFSARGHIELTGRNFGVWKFTPNGWQKSHIEPVDIALPRTEHASDDALGGYRDVMTQSDPNLPIEEDLKRRDFTINAMAYNTSTGTILDSFNGQQDIKEKRIRAVGDARERFSEDLSRMLRAIRFAAQLGFEIESETFEAIKEQMPLINQMRKRRLDEGERARGKKSEREFVVPRETIGKEIAKALVANPERTLALLKSSGALRELLPEIDAFADDAQYLRPLATTKTHDATVIAALMLRGSSSVRAREHTKAIGVSSLPTDSPYRVREDEVEWIVEHLAEDQPNMMTLRANAFERLYMNERGGRYLACLEALGQSSTVHEVRDRARQIRDRWPVGKGEKIKTLVNGGDVLSLGITAGPRVRELLETTRDAQLDGKIMDRDSALVLLKSLATE